MQKRVTVLKCGHVARGLLESSCLIDINVDQNIGPDIR